jgi:hypothetical protein
MAYTFFPTSAIEVSKTLKPKNVSEKTKIQEINALLSYLQNNAKTKKVIATPINIDPTNISMVNISRKIKGILTEKQIATAVGLKTLKIKFGDGSAGGRGVNNKGNKFEKDLGPAFKSWWSGKKVTDADLNYSIDEVYDITNLKNFSTLDVDAEAGAKNTKRPIQYTPNIHLYSTSADNNIGDMLTDITLIGTVGNKKQNIYLSLKTTSTVTFFNVGIKEVLPTSEIKSGNISNKNGLKLLKMFSIDPSVFCDVYNQKSFKGYSEDINLTASQTSNIQTFLESGIGYGYTVVHQIRKGNVKVFNVTKKYMQDAAKPNSLKIYYGGKTGTGKRVDMEIITNKYLLKLNIRDTQGKDGYPTRLMCDFSYL